MHNIDDSMDELLSSDSDFIESLCEQLEEDGIHLTKDLLANILSAYEEQKFVLVKNHIEQLIREEGVEMTGGQDGHPILKFILDGKMRHEDEDDENDPFITLDTKYIC